MANVEAGNGVMICDKWTRWVAAPDLYSISLDISHRISFGWKITAKNVAIALFINEFEKALEDALYQK